MPVAVTAHCVGDDERRGARPTELVKWTPLAPSPPGSAPTVSRDVQGAGALRRQLTCVEAVEIVQLVRLFVAVRITNYSRIPRPPSVPVLRPKHVSEKAEPCCEDAAIGGVLNAHPR